MTWGWKGSSERKGELLGGELSQGSTFNGASQCGTQASEAGGEYLGSAWWAGCKQAGYDEAPRLGVVLEGRETGKEPRTAQHAQEGNKVRFS